jgi:hypothetical protein
LDKKEAKIKYRSRQSGWVGTKDALTIEEQLKYQKMMGFKR